MITKQSFKIKKSPKFPTSQSLEKQSKMAIHRTHNATCLTTLRVGGVGRHQSIHASGFHLKFSMVTPPKNQLPPLAFFIMDFTTKLHIFFSERFWTSQNFQTDFVALYWVAHSNDAHGNACAWSSNSNNCGAHRNPQMWTLPPKRARPVMTVRPQPSKYSIQDPASKKPRMRLPSLSMTPLAGEADLFSRLEMHWKKSRHPKLAGNLEDHMATLPELHCNDCNDPGPSKCGGKMAKVYIETSPWACFKPTMPRRHVGWFFEAVTSWARSPHRDPRGPRHLAGLIHHGWMDLTGLATKNDLFGPIMLLSRTSFPPKKTRWSPRTRMPTRMLRNKGLILICHNVQRTHLWNTLIWHTEVTLL